MRKMETVKKCLLSILIAVYVITAVSSDVLAEDLQDCEVNSQLNYGDYELEWHRGSTDIFDSLERVSENGITIAEYKYDENGNRVRKIIGDEVTDFQYTKDLYLDTVKSSYGNIRYSYVFKNNSNIKTISGFTFENTEYNFVYDNYDNIIAIKQNDKEIAKYIYDDNGTFKYTLCKENGVWTECDRQDFVGNVNKVRFKQAYYDEETGWYYCGRYYDTSCVRYIDGVDIGDSTRGRDFNLLESNSAFTIEFVPQEKIRTSYSEIETICRILYCEAGTSSYDWDAVAWAVYYRIRDNGRSALSELTQTGEFSSYTNGLYMFDTSNWYNKNKWNICYENAQNLMNKCAPNRSVPYITKQKHFNSVNTFGMHYDSDGRSTQYYDNKYIYNVAIPGSTIIPPSIIYSDYHNLYSNSQGLFNIYFSFEK